MIKVHDSEGNDIGQYDGRFVYDRNGEKRYWIEGGDVFSIPQMDRKDGQGARANVQVATLAGRVAIDEDGVTVFTL